MRCVELKVMNLVIRKVRKIGGCWTMMFTIPVGIGQPYGSLVFSNTNCNLSIFFCIHTVLFNTNISISNIKTIPCAYLHVYITYIAYITH